MSQPTRLHDLPDGRAIATMEFGDPGGRPLLFFHGVPGSRRGAWLLGEAAAQTGLRLVALDRPGFGRSDPAGRRTLRGWAADVATVADDLGLGRFAVAGASGGGPHALACAAVLGGRVSAALVLNGMAPPDDPDVAARHAKTLALARRATWLVALGATARSRALRSSNPRPRQLERVLRTLAGELDGLFDADSAAGREALDQVYASFGEAFRQGGRAMAVELAMLARPWDIDLDNIVAPVLFWHGKEDALVPLTAATRLAARVPGAVLHTLPGGHAAYLRHLDAVFGAFLTHTTA